MAIAARKRWSAQPFRVRCVLVVYVIGFLVGTWTHALNVLRDGIHAYPMFPQVPLRAFFVGLVLLDPLVVVLLGLLRREGIALAGLVMVLDLAGNGWGNRHWLHDDPAQLIPLIPLALFGAFVVASFLPLLRTVTAVARRAVRPATER